MAENSILSMPLERLAGELAELGQPAYRAGQVFAWLHQKRAKGFDEMTSLPAALRRQLAGRYAVDRPRVAQRQVSADGTVKLLLELCDGGFVETVLMRYRHGLSVCISSQVGCRMGCRFCASAKLGFGRNLTAGEMAGQVYAACEEAAGGAEALRANHLVLMGVGEPLDNFDSVADFLEIIQYPGGYNMAGRNISLSTCGVVPGIERLARLGHALTLSLSLHAADDATRSRLMPVNDRWPLAQVMAACRDYQRETGRRVSYEYVLLPGQNDGEGDALALAGLLRGSGGHLNLIPMNPVEGAGYAAGDTVGAAAFARRVQALGVQTTVRRRLGADIDAACGQLRARSAKESIPHATL